MRRWGVMRRIVLLLIFFVFSMAGYAYAGQDSWLRVADGIERALHSAVQSYEAGKANEAMEKVADAYFGIFEGEKANMEIAVRRFISLKKATELERRFGELRKAMHGKAPLPGIKKQAAELVNALKESARELNRKGVGYNF